jgi:hypothetical protein
MSEMEETVSIPEAGRLLGLTTEQVLDLVFLKELESIEAPSGRRIVPASAIERWRLAHPATA